MDISTDPKILGLLLRHLETKQPESLLVYYLVRHVRDKKWDKTQVFVDDVSMVNCTTVLCHSPSALTDNIDDGSWFVYCEDQRGLKSLLHQVGVAEGRGLDGRYHTNNILFEDFNGKFLPTITEYMKANGYKVRKNFARPLYVANFDKTTIAHMQRNAPAPPPGYKIASLKPEHAGLVASNTFLSSMTSAPIIRKIIEEFPSIAVYTPDRDDPVSWSMVKQHGVVGFAYTLPEFRNMKLMQMHSQMTSRLPEYGYKLCFITEDDNAPTQHTIKKSPLDIPVVHQVNRTYFRKISNNYISVDSKL
ncbi:glycine N-acyltransferase-like [Glandiceps talaboti]